MRFLYIDLCIYLSTYPNAICIQVAMLKTLDPYTEYQNLKVAQNMQESVQGKYGGVGLVISGNE